jgi:hypothetical protein
MIDVFGTKMLENPNENLEIMINMLVKMKRNIVYDFDYRHTKSLFDVNIKNVAELKETLELLQEELIIENERKVRAIIDDFEDSPDEKIEKDLKEMTIEDQIDSENESLQNESTAEENPQEEMDEQAIAKAFEQELGKGLKEEVEKIMKDTQKMNQVDNPKKRKAKEEYSCFPTEFFEKMDKPEDIDERLLAGIRKRIMNGPFQFGGYRIWIPQANKNLIGTFLLFFF